MIRIVRTTIATGALGVLSVTGLAGPATAAQGTATPSGYNAPAAGKTLTRATNAAKVIARDAKSAADRLAAVPPAGSKRKDSLSPNSMKNLAQRAATYDTKRTALLTKLRISVDRLRGEFNASLTAPADRDYWTQHADQRSAMEAHFVRVQAEIGLAAKASATVASEIKDLRVEALGASVSPKPNADDLAAYLWAKRAIESGQNYTATSKISTASGAYQYLDSAWQDPARKAIWSKSGNYPRAFMAPPAVQDAVARADALRTWETYKNWRQVAMAQYVPAWAGDQTKWDTAPSAGAPTLRQYANRVLGLMVPAPTSNVVRK